MKFIQSVLFCILGLAANLSEAVPVRWAVPSPVTLSGNYILSGSFTADSDTFQLVSSDIAITLNGTPINLHNGVYGIFEGTLGNVSGRWLYFLAGNSIGSLAIAITYSSLTNAGGSAYVDMASGTCTTVRSSDNVCTGFTGNVTHNVRLTGTAVPTIPTLSEWCLMLLALLTGSLGHFSHHRHILPARGVVR